jgi:hypothetical protein
MVPMSAKQRRLDLLAKTAEEFARQNSDPYAIACQFAWAGLFAMAIGWEDTAQRLLDRGMRIYQSWVSAPAAPDAAVAVQS